MTNAIDFTPHAEWGLQEQDEPRRGSERLVISTIVIKAHLIMGRFFSYAVSEIGERRLSGRFEGATSAATTVIEVSVVVPL